MVPTRERSSGEELNEILAATGTKGGCIIPFNKLLQLMKRVAKDRLQIECI
jgi:hypothetical protein